MSEISRFITIAIDGGAASGKSSTSRAIAERLNLMHVDTGSHYRTLTYALLKKGVHPEALEAVKAELHLLSLSTELEERSAQMAINREVPSTAEIRSPLVNDQVSLFSALSVVREFLFNYQRDQVAIAREKGFHGLVMEGRDIGSVIFPDADFRFFLFADETTRSARRAREGQTDSIAARDKLDSSRKTAPLVCAEGAVRIDTGPLSLSEVVERVCGVILGD